MVDCFGVPWDWTKAKRGNRVSLSSERDDHVNDFLKSCDGSQNKLLRRLPFVGAFGKYISESRHRMCGAALPRACTATSQQNRLVSFSGSRCPCSVGVRSVSLFALNNQFHTRSTRKLLRCVVDWHRAAHTMRVSPSHS